MSSFKNLFKSRIYKERSQPNWRKKFGILEKHKDYVVRAKAYHKKQDALQRLKEKASSRNPDEFYFKMIKTRTVDGVHKPESQANKYSAEELMIMNTQDVGYVVQKIQIEKNKLRKLSATLHSIDNKAPSNKHMYYAEDGEEAEKIQARTPEKIKISISEDVPPNIKRKMEASYKEMEARKKRVGELEKIRAEMSLKKELQKKGRRRILREDELVCSTSGPVYRWEMERKR